MGTITQLLPVSYVLRDEYDRIDRVNFSKLKHMGKSPAHYEHALTAKCEDTDAMKRGRAVHLAAFEPERFRAECVVWDMGTRRGSDWEEFKLRNKGREILTEGMNEVALAISKAARSSAMAAPYLSGGKGEQTVQWTHVEPEVLAVEGFSVDCKGRLDFISKAGALVDLKTCADASPEAFGRQVANLEYHVQAAWYVDGYKAATGVELPYVIVAVEAKAPFIVQVYRVPVDLLQLGRERYRGLLRRLHQCRQESSWPGYSDGVLDLCLPKWAAPAVDEDDGTGLGLVIG